MALGLLTVHLAGLAFFAYTCFGVGDGTLAYHIGAGLIAVMLVVFAHTMSYFYLVAMTSMMRKALAGESGPAVLVDDPRGPELLARSRRLKASAMPWAMGGMEGVNRVHGIGDDLVIAVLQAVVIVDVGVVAVGVVDVADIFFFPDAMRDAHDVVDDIDIRVFEAAHALDALRAWIAQEGIRPAFGREGNRIIGRHDAGTISDGDGLGGLAAGRFRGRVFVHGGAFSV